MTSMARERYEEGAYGGRCGSRKGKDRHGLHVGSDVR